MSFLRRLFGNTNDAEIKKLQRTVDAINAFEPAMRQKSDAEFKALTMRLRDDLKSGKTMEDILPEAYAAVREATVRTLGKRQFDVQMMGGVILHQGRIAEMKTGEGKTYTAIMPAYLNALAGGSVHIVTVNDYLAKFQGEMMRRMFRFLGMSVGIVLHDIDAGDRQAAYACDVVYATNNELGFDYLRDNMAIFKQNMVQRDLTFAIVDEVDSILIDEARTPLIISGQGDKSTELYARAESFARSLAPGDYDSDEKLRTVTLTDRGVTRAERFFGVENLSDMENTEINHHINQALKARVMMRRDIDYVVKDGEIIIVDEFTGRLMLGRRYSEGLHQAIEAKEGVDVQNESRTLATITFQNYFRMYKKLSGMTGTAKTEEEEFKGIYNLDVVCVPTNMPMIRQDLPDCVYRTQAGKYKSVVDEIKARHQTGQPVLVGTVSVEKSEMLSAMLTRSGIPHTVLNAKFHEREAEIVAQAGKEGSVTIATNMAGRGTDILLGGNPEFTARKRMRQEGYDEAVIEAAQSFSEELTPEELDAQRLYRGYLSEYEAQADAEHDRVVALGGLHIIGTERHESRRIDNQLRGRAGRQGDPGSSRFYLSMEDDLLRLFGTERMAPMIERLGVAEDEAISAGILAKQIENAQKRVEGRNYDSRKSVLEYDDVMNQQRTIIYDQRRQVLEGNDVRQSVTQMMDSLIERTARECCPDNAPAEEWDFETLNHQLSRYFLPENYFSYTEKELMQLSFAGLTGNLRAQAADSYARREAEAAEAGIDMREVERVLLLRAVDEKWMDHIDNMDQLRRGIGLRAVGQRNPVQEYKFEGYDMFEAMIESIQDATIFSLMHVMFNKPVERKQVAKPQAALHGDGDAEAVRKKPAKAAQKVGRNDPCPCGSGKKYKHCHGANA